ncbi:sigma-54 dependent transcriptional regulator [Zoogloea sp.]|uniref:sigma-54-dependent transcriptional regulator n=1 Tax=Zoogloea sp. TaxID=49181 RepID=UPI00261DC626|nr:sigma-54 dependent transcriptional regulator [Zoogloea sp.]
MTSILIIDDETTLARNAARFLEKGGHGATTASTGREGLKLFGELQPDAVVLDFRLPDMDGLAVIAAIRADDAQVPIIMITGHGSIELAVEAMKAGANDLLTKPVALGELRQRIAQLTQRQRENSRLQYYEARERDRSQLDAIVGASPAVAELRDRIARIASVEGIETLPPVLIIGETGTGKELVARACHFCSPRRDKPFVEVNCAAIPASLLESELFGHERGAFTDARERKLGLLEAADGGTLFLDEIGEMDRGLQAKLLKVLEDGRLRRLGSVQERQVNVRILAATNQDLEKHIEAGLFRADLYFRLRVLQIHVPPLNAREGDVLVLARHFLADFAQRYRKGALQLSPAAERLLVDHDWPGNVRELRNLMEQAALLASDSLIGPDDLPLSPARRPGNPAAAPDTGTSALERVERDLLVQALADTRGNVSQAARQLGISRDTLRYRMEKHGLPGKRPPG